MPRRLARLGLVVAIMAGSLVLAASPAAACSCGPASDAEYFDWADVVFTGELVDYSFVEDPDGDGISSSADPAVWTFEVIEVWKGDAAPTQPVLSPVSGASCGLEIPKTGTFHVFATHTDPNDWLGFRPGNLQASLCGGTRAVSAAALEFGAEVTPSDPTSTEPATTSVAPTTTTEATTTAPPATTLPVDDETIDPVDQAAGGTVLAVGFVVVGIVGVIVAVRLAKKRREAQEW